MDYFVVISTALAAAAALLSAFSAFASWRATRAVEEDVRLAKATTRYELFRSFESDYSSQYDAIWRTLGPWDDPVKVDPNARRVVHDVLQSMSSIYTARQLGLIDPPQAACLTKLFADWLGVPQARSIWKAVFMHQDDTWPKGFVDYVENSLTTATRPGPTVAN